MHFSTKVRSINFDSYTRFKIIRAAKSIIQTFNWSQKEVILDEYLRENFNLKLQNACYFILNHIIIQKNNKNTFTVTFSNSTADKLAKLITYGNEKVKGSEILQVAFGTYFD